MKSDLMTLRPELDAIPEHMRALEQLARAPRTVEHETFLHDVKTFEREPIRFPRYVVIG
jgi:hypothetical protein